MTDVLWATIHQKSVSIYGFEYDPKTYPAISQDPVCILVRNKEQKDADFDEQIQKSHEFLLILESKLKFSSSKLEKVEHGDGGAVWMFTVDKKWIHASPLFSMLSLFLRVGCHYKGQGRLNEAISAFKEVNHNDAGYLKESRNMRQLIFKKGLGIFAPKMEDNYPDSDVHTVHDQWGIVNSKRCSSFTNIWDLKGIDTVVQKKKKKKKKKKTTRSTAKKKAKKKAKLTKKKTKTTKKKARAK